MPLLSMAIQIPRVVPVGPTKVNAPVLKFKVYKSGVVPSVVSAYMVELVLFHDNPEYVTPVAAPVRGATTVMAPVSGSAAQNLVLVLPNAYKDPVTSKSEA